MIPKIPISSFYARYRSRVLYGAGICAATLSLMVAIAAYFIFSKKVDGIYLLKGQENQLFELKTRILLGEYERMVMEVEFDDIRHLFYKRIQHPINHPYLENNWDETTGSGYVRSHFPGNRRLVIALGRFKDSDGQTPAGLFLGGGLPYGSYAYSSVNLNETGMAYFDGVNMTHLWCNANEALVVERMTFPPSQWEYRGSEVMFETNEELIIRSRHRVTVSGGALSIDRFAFFRAGDLFFTLMIKIRNSGRTPVAYQYIYGDEPWVGNYGSSSGNVGWTRDGLHRYEGRIDTTRHTYAGMADYGNKAIPEERDRIFSNRANFIQWLGEVRPDVAYFSNSIGSYADEKARVPLSSPDNRVLFLEWGPRELYPDQSEIIMLAIGMAGVDPEKGLPLKPDLRLNRENLDYVISNSD